MALQQYFGTDGIRGKAGEGLITPGFMLQLGWAAGTILARGELKPRIILGRDTRQSGEMLQSALQAGLTAAGVDVLLADVIPTPGIAYLTHSLRAAAGIVISASHNPYYDNGVKFFNAEGMKLSDTVELEIESLIDSPMVIADDVHIGNVHTLEGTDGRYIEFCKSTFPFQLSLMGLKIIIDCAHGATHKVGPMVFHELGADVIVIGDQPTGLNINDGCGATDLELLQKTVRQEHADLGIAFDGDGDRLIMVDHLGEIVDGDEILCILAHDRVTGMKGHAGVVGTLMSNWGLERSFADHNIDFVRSNVGDRYVLEVLKERGWSLGGESSGHIVDLDYTTTGDGIISALQVLRVMLLSKVSLNKIKQSMQKTPQLLINVPVERMFNVDEHPDIQQAIAQAEEALNQSGRVLLRPSGTQPYIRVMVEGTDQQLVQRLANQLAEKVKMIAEIVL